jgi:hypothetical protein
MADLLDMSARARNSAPGQTELRMRRSRLGKKLPLSNLSDARGRIMAGALPVGDKCVDPQK